MASNQCSVLWRGDEELEKDHHQEGAAEGRDLVMRRGEHAARIRPSR